MFLVAFDVKSCSENKLYPYFWWFLPSNPSNSAPSINFIDIFGASLPNPAAIINFIDIFGGFSSRFSSSHRFFGGVFWWPTSRSLQLFSSQWFSFTSGTSFFPPDPSFSTCITEVLEVRTQEFGQLEEQKRQRRSFLCLCRSIEDVVKGTRWVNGASSVVVEWGDAS